jgi:hypothetical protein
MPTVAPSTALGPQWSREDIVQQQAADVTLAEVRKWLNFGEKPEWSTLKGDVSLRCYFQQFDSLLVIDNVMYRIFVDGRGNVKYYQLLASSQPA